MRGFRLAKCDRTIRHTPDPQQHQIGPRGDDMMGMMREMMAPLMPM